MCPIGDGVIDYPGDPCLPRRERLRGLHHCRAGADLRNAAGSLADVKKSRDYLKSVGFSDGLEDRT
ncbi:MAG: hypothetical protein R3D59_10375 [Paracoccaceae bacterium]